MISRSRSSRGAVAAVGVGVVALHQELEPGLDLGRRGVDLEPERVERLALGIADRAAFPGLLACASRSGRAELGEHAERVVAVPVKALWNRPPAAAAVARRRRSCPSSRSGDGR